MTRSRDDDGAITTELVIVVPVAIALLCLIAFVGRTATAREQVDETARDAARTASLQRDPLTAHDAGVRAADASLDRSGLRCQSRTVEVNTTSFAPGGQVTVTVACDVSLSELGLIGLSGTRTITSTSVSVVDTYRGVGDGFSNSEGSSGANSGVGDP